MHDQRPDKTSISVGRPHVVILGAGASKAAFPKGEKQGKSLPVMNELVNTVDGLSDYLNQNNIHYDGCNFEDLYSSLCSNPKYDDIRQTIEYIIYIYFSSMKLPDEPTIYDHLILSLTHRDLIATFNWDPLLWQAVCRNASYIGKDNLPLTVYLHGSTGIGICKEHQPVVVGALGGKCPRCSKTYERSRLLYPITKKDYTNDLFIKKGWDVVKKALKSAYMFTIYGYSAPSSDIEAIQLLQEGWGSWQARNYEQIEIIDILDSDMLSMKWKTFIHTHHYGTMKTFYESFIYKYCRRSCDALWDATMQCNPRDENSIPINTTWDHIKNFVRPLIEVEEAKRRV
jgi:hypothetical protein